jgi:hypothetical protein
VSLISRGLLLLPIVFGSLAPFGGVSLAQPANIDQSQHKAVLASVRAEVLRVVGTGGPAGDIVEVTATSGILTVVRVNSTMNTATHGERNMEANTIAILVTKAILGRSEFTSIVSIRIKYISRPRAGGREKVIDAIEFRETPDGSFPLHAT